MTSRTLYDVLGVSPSASSSEIKRAYLDLARVYHPDVSSSSPREDDDTFAKISHAYDVLKNPVSRRAYDAVALAPTTRRSSVASSRAWSPANANWRRRPGFEIVRVRRRDDDDGRTRRDARRERGARAASRGGAGAREGEGRRGEVVETRARGGGATEEGVRGEGGGDDGERASGSRTRRARCGKRERGWCGKMRW